MKRLLIPALASAFCFVIGSCERHSWEDTKSLHHGHGGEHGDGHGDGDGKAEGHGDKDGDKESGGH